MYLGNSSADYVPAFALTSIFIIFLTLVIMRKIKRMRVKKQVLDVVNIKGLRIDKMLHYFSYECFLVDYYTKCRAADSLVSLHRNYVTALYRALLYAGVSKDDIEEYENRKEERL